MVMVKNVALLVGGWSSEREVSLYKGKYIAQALIDGGYDVRVVDVTRDLRKLLDDLTPAPDVVFNNLYGRGGEDGTIQAVLEMLGLPYTHSGVLASAVGMDKTMTKILAQSVGVRVADGVLASREDVLTERVMDRPYVVKPVNEGSSVGVRIVLQGDNHAPLDAASWTFGDVVMVERYVPGREIHVAVLDGKAQGVTEIIVPGRFFDYEAKYSDSRTQLITPADIPADVAAAAMDFSEKTYRILGCEGLARCDLRYDDSKPGADGVYFLEINTMPGLSPGSIALIQPEQNGMSYVQLCSHLVETARCHADPKAQEPEKAPSSIAAAATARRGG